MEEDAYRRGNLIFRDWENQKNIKENKKMKVTKEELKDFVYEAMKELLAEQSRTDLPDRARPEGGSRLDEEDEEIEDVLYFLEACLEGMSCKDYTQNRARLIAKNPGYIPEDDE